MREFAPELGPERRADDADAYATYWGEATESEIAVALGRREPRMPDAPVGSFSSGGESAAPG